MRDLEEDLSEIDLPCKPIKDVVDKFHSRGILNHRGQDQDNSTTSESSSNPPSQTKPSAKLIQHNQWRRQQELRELEVLIVQPISRINTVRVQHSGATV